MLKGSLFFDVQIEKLALLSPEPGMHKKFERTGCEFFQSANRGAQLRAKQASGPFGIQRCFWLGFLKVSQTFQYGGQTWDFLQLNRERAGLARRTVACAAHPEELSNY